MNDIVIHEALEEDAGKVIGIFNHYVEGRFAACPETLAPLAFYAMIREGEISLPVAVREGTILVFRVLIHFLPFPAFRWTEKKDLMVANCDRT